MSRRGQSFLHLSLSLSKIRFCFEKEVSVGLETLKRWFVMFLYLGSLFLLSLSVSARGVCERDFSVCVMTILHLSLFSPFHLTQHKTERQQQQGSIVVITYCVRSAAAKLVDNFGTFFDLCSFSTLSKHTHTQRERERE